jgi:hypothetical protein
MGRLLDRAQIVEGFAPVDLQAAANDGDWVSLKNYNHVTVIFHKKAGTAGDDPTLTLEQATAVAGTSAKGLNFTRIFTKQGAALNAVGTFTEVTQTAASTYTDATSAEVAAIWVVEIDAQDLDVNGGFDCVRARVADVGGNAQLGSLLYILTEARFGASPMPSAIID